jgi:nucleotide-binding universal stress UspA family protein
MKTLAQRVEPTEVLELVPQILRLKKILVPIDFSETSKKAFQYALKFAEQFDCEITLLNVVEPISATVGAPLAVENISGYRRRVLGGGEKTGRARGRVARQRREFC